MNMNIARGNRNKFGTVLWRERVCTSSDERISGYLGYYPSVLQRNTHDIMQLKNSFRPRFLDSVPLRFAHTRAANDKDTARLPDQAHYPNTSPALNLGGSLTLSLTRPWRRVAVRERQGVSGPQRGRWPTSLPLTVAQNLEKNGQKSTLRIFFSKSMRPFLLERTRQ